MVKLDVKKYGICPVVTAIVDDLKSEKKSRIQIALEHDLKASQVTYFYTKLKKVLSTINDENLENLKQENIKRCEKEAKTEDIEQMLLEGLSIQKIFEKTGTSLGNIRKIRENLVKSDPEKLPKNSKTMLKTLPQFDEIVQALILNCSENNSSSKKFSEIADEFEVDRYAVYYLVRRLREMKKIPATSNQKNNKKVIVELENSDNEEEITELIENALNIYFEKDNNYFLKNVDGDIYLSRT